MNILAIYDNEKILLLIEAQIAKIGLKIDTTESAYTGLELVDKKDYDLILLDLNMPEMNGLEVGKRIREKGKRRLIIYAFSADEEQLSESSMSIFDGIYNKPHDANLLLKDIQRIQMDLAK